MDDAVWAEPEIPRGDALPEAKVTQHYKNQSKEPNLEHPINSLKMALFQLLIILSSRIIFFFVRKFKIA